VRSGVALALMLLSLVLAANAPAQVRARPAKTPAAGELFVLTAAGGELQRVRGQNRVFKLVLRRPAHDVTGFTDRPARRTGQHPLSRFVRSWARLGFAEVPPNAAVVLADAPSNRDVLVVELSRPRLGAGGRTLAFRAEALSGNPTGLLRGFARSGDRRIAARFGRASLFIDPGGQVATLLFTLSNVPPGGVVSISFVDEQGQGNSQIDLAADIFVNTDGPTRFLNPGVFVASTRGFALTATGDSPLNGNIQITIAVDAGAQCARGGAIIRPVPGASATVRVGQTGQAFPLGNGDFCIPITRTP
jgi:hypothetical protein